MLPVKKLTKIIGVFMAFCLCLATVDMLSLPAQAIVTASTVPNGVYHIKKQGVAYFLEPGSVIATKTYDMSQRRYKGSEIQQWKFEKLSSAGYYRIINVYTGQVLGIEGNSSADLARIETQPWSSSNMYQNWYIYSLGSGKYEIVNRYTGKTFTNSGANNGTDGTRIVQWPRRGTIWYEFGSDGELSKLGGLPHRTITLQREGDLTSNATWLPIITTACNSWTTSAGANIGTTATGSSFFIIEVDSYSWAAYGRCIKWPQENVASTSGRIEINARTINATTNARRSTVAHEIGHLLWLSDNPAVSNDNNSLMAGGRNRETVFTPQPYDIQNVLFRYN